VGRREKKVDVELSTVKLVIVNEIPREMTLWLESAWRHLIFGAFPGWAAWALVGLLNALTAGMTDPWRPLLLPELCFEHPANEQQ
jgi:hypothetical protein